MILSIVFEKFIVLELDVLHLIVESANALILNSSQLAAHGLLYIYTYGNYKILTRSFGDGDSDACTALPCLYP